MLQLVTVQTPNSSRWCRPFFRDLLQVIAAPPEVQIVSTPFPPGQNKEFSVLLRPPQMWIQHSTAGMWHYRVENLRGMLERRESSLAGTTPFHREQVVWSTHGGLRRQQINYHILIPEKRPKKTNKQTKNMQEGDVAPSVPPSLDIFRQTGNYLKFNQLLKRGALSLHRARWLKHRKVYIWPQLASQQADYLSPSLWRQSSACNRCNYSKLKQNNNNTVLLKTFNCRAGR